MIQDFCVQNIGILNIMGESVSFKVTLLSKDSQTRLQNRKFTLPNNFCNSFGHFRRKIRDVFCFEIVSTTEICWEDKDGDLVTLDSNEEFQVAITESQWLSGSTSAYHAKGPRFDPRQLHNLSLKKSTVSPK